jgi:uncharacterized phage protein gp47/JayE
MRIPYVNRSYEQIKATVLARVATFAPEITDHNEGNPFSKAIGVWAGLIEMLGYYVDNHAREAHIPTARLWASMWKHARAHDYTIKGPRAATVDVLFTLSGVAGVDVTVPEGAQLRSTNGLRWVTVEACTIPAGELYGVTAARQFSTQTSPVVVGQPDGTANQEVTLTTDKSVDNSTVYLDIDGDAYDMVETLGYSNPLARHYVSTLDVQGRPSVVFGDGFAGVIPYPGDIFANWATTAGAAGNVAAGMVNQITDTPTTPSGITVSVTNPSAAAGGSDMESIEQLRWRIPRANRTLQRAVTAQDHKDIAELYPSVSRAGVYFACGKTIDIYIVPEGGGVASSLLCSTVRDWFEQFRMIATQVRIYPAGGVRLLPLIDLRVRKGYSNLTVANAVKARLAAFLSYQNQEVGGQLRISDLYEVIENTDGVENSDIVAVRPVPYARPILGTALPLVWSPTLLVGSTDTVRWRITMTSGTDFQLFRNNAFVGTFTVASLVTRTEVEFTVSASAYSAGDKWEFVTYPYNNFVSLSEPSILVALVGDITINATGGL